ncbi:MAG: sodium:solute symporter [Bacteroidota bacterium]
MATLDWIVLVGTLLAIVLYGLWKTRNVDNVQSYLLGDRELKWWTIGLSIMATQASAITFLSTPGQAFDDGMRFAQFYFGLPIAMVILSIFVIPIYYRLKVYTAYEYLEGRFDLRTRTLTAILFLVQRGLAAGITIYAPAIILSTIMEWDLFFTILLIGLVVIFYTVFGGTNAVSQTQKQQMIVILGGMFVAFMIILFRLPEDVSFGDAVGLAGKMGKLNIVDFEFDLDNRYNMWSAMLGGTFLFLSYFGTDQSQVQRYLSGKSLTESRLGLLFNGIFKVPMQFMILFVGIMVFVFFEFTQPPLHFNDANQQKLVGTSYESRYNELQEQHNQVFEDKRLAARELITAIRSDNEATISQAQTKVTALQAQDKVLRTEFKELLREQDPDSDTEDNDYVFIYFVINYLPVGLVGLLIAVIFSAAMSSTASEINALATTSVIDLYRRQIRPNASDQHYLSVSKWMTIGWGLIALAFAAFASLFDNLIEAVNIIGSVFYGTILGIFLVAFFLKRVGGRAVFPSALIAEAIVITVFMLDKADYLHIAYLWLNLIGCVLVVVLSLLSQSLISERKTTAG